MSAAAADGRRMAAAAVARLERHLKEDGGGRGNREVLIIDMVERMVLNLWRK